jgi:DNA replication factor GINS
MNIDELRSAQSKERQKSDLQQLRESFYGDVAAYVEELEAERERAAERADDPFGSPEVQQLTNDIETAKDTAEAIYERRLGKIVKKASLVSAEMANPNDVNGLTAEEQALFADLVDRIEANKAHMLDVIAGDASPGPREDAAGSADAADGDASTVASKSAASADAGASDPDVPHPEDGLGAAAGDGTDATDATDAPGAADAGQATDGTQGADSTDDEDLLRSEAEAIAGLDDDRQPDDAPESDDATSVSAADLMGGDDAVDTATDRDAPDASGSTDTGAPSNAPNASGSTEAADASGSNPDADERATLRVTEDVGEIFGVDEREYTLTSEDVVTLPEENADALVAQGAAERLD